MSKLKELTEKQWLRILDPKTKDLLWLMAFNKRKDCVNLSLEDAKKLIGLNGIGVKEAIDELSALGLIRVLNNKELNYLKQKMRNAGIEPRDIIVLLENPPLLDDFTMDLLISPFTKKQILSLVLKEPIEKKEIKKMEEKAQSIKDKENSSVFELLAKLLHKAQENNKRFKNIYDVITVLKGDKEDEREEIIPKNEFFQSLTNSQKQVVIAFEKWTGNIFPQKELPLVNESLQYCFPNMIIAGIKRVVSSGKNVESFSYFMRPIQNGAWGKRPKKKTGGKSNKNKQEQEKKGGRKNVWADQYKKFKKTSN
ncbi:MAG: hypothetical protein ACOCQR_02645 [bacterium]